MNLIEFMTSLLESNPNVVSASPTTDEEIGVEMADGTMFFITVEPA